MAFDMYAGDRHEAIYAQDEYLFAYIAEAPREFPQLKALHSHFYSEIRLTPEQAELLVHQCRRKWLIPSSSKLSAFCYGSGRPLTANRLPR